MKLRKRRRRQEGGRGEGERGARVSVHVQDVTEYKGGGQTV
jgi:hypothetical protein